MWSVGCEMWDVRCEMWDVRCEMLDGGFGMGHAARECSPTDHADFHRCRAGCFIKKHETRRSPTDQRKVIAPMRTDVFFHGLFTLAPLPTAWVSMRRRRKGSTRIFCRRKVR